MAPFVAILIAESASSSLDPSTSPNRELVSLIFNTFTVICTNVVYLSQYLFLFFPFFVDLLSLNDISVYSPCLVSAISLHHIFLYKRLLSGLVDRYIHGSLFLYNPVLINTRQILTVTGVCANLYRPTRTLIPPLQSY